MTTSKQDLTVNSKNQCESKLITKISHVVRTPLNTAFGFSSLLRETTMNTEQLTYLDYIDKALELLLKNVNELINVNDEVYDSPVIAAPPIDLQKARILLIDDFYLNRFIIKLLLEKWNAIVIDTIDGNSALTHLKEKQFDVILMDLELPGLDGFSITKIIREELKLETPIIALTANVCRGIIEKCLTAGMNEFVSKPFHQLELQNKIVNELQKSNMSKKHIENHKPIVSSISYDLSKLKKMMGDDKNSLDRMIRLFIELTPNAIRLIKQSYSDHKIDEVYRIAHSLKPSVDLIGIHEMKVDIREIEELAKKGEETEVLARIIDKVERNCMQVIELLKQEVD